MISIGNLAYKIKGPLGDLASSVDKMAACSDFGCSTLKSEEGFLQLLAGQR